MFMLMNMNIILFTQAKEVFVFILYDVAMLIDFDKLVQNTYFWYSWN